MLLFFGVFFIYGIFVNSNDQNAYTLQHAGIEALAERGTLYVDGSPTPQLKQVGDVFNHEGHLYAAKQPGQFFIGAVIYFILHLFGFSYANNYLLASSLVTWFTSCLMTSGIVIMLFKITLIFTRNKRLGLLASIFYGFGTMAFPYSGVTHHDAYGAFFIFASFYLLVVNHYANPSGRIIYPILSGIAAGLSIFTSVLPLFILIAEILYLLSYKRLKHILLFMAFCAISASPLLLYNYFSFGNPILPANIAGNFNDTYPIFSLENIIKKIRFYLFSPNTSIYVFSPIVVFSFIGILFIPRQYIKERLFLLFQSIFLFSYLTMMTTVGHCQYGPRYLIPTLPFLGLGLCGYWMGFNSGFFSKILGFKYLKAIIIIAGATSIVISTVGACQGTMYCSLDIWAFRAYLAKIIRGSFPEFPLFKVAAPLLLVTFFVSIVRHKEGLQAYLLPKSIAVKRRLAAINRLWLTNNLYLIAIIFLAFFLRVILLKEAPNGFYADEASIGYNAYSILQTGKDEHGELMPLYFRAFGEYKNPVYIYSVIPFIKLFGLNEFAVRFTSALFGTLTVLFTYLLARELVNKRCGLWASLLLAISPWHLQFSRIAFEAISLPCLFTLGLYLLLKGLKKGRYLFYSAPLLALSFYTYAPAKLFLPLFLAGFFGLNYYRLARIKREIILSILLGLLILAPLIIFTFKGQAQTRFNIISIFTNHSLNLTREGILDGKYWSPSLFKGLVGHKGFLISYSFIRNYLLHISPKFLIFQGDLNLRHNIGTMGQLFKFEGILLVIGFIFIILRKKRWHWMILLWWFFIFPVSSSLTYESVPHAIRSICGLPVFQIIGAIGIVSSFSYIKRLSIDKLPYKKYVHYPAIVISILFLVFSLSNIRYYFLRYYTIYPKTQHYAWDYGMREIIQTAERLDNFDAFSFMDMGDPYIFILFYARYDPEKWQKSRHFDRYIFDSFGDSIHKRQALIVKGGAYPQYPTIHTVFLPDGTPGYEIKEVEERKIEVIELSEVKPEFIGGLEGRYFNGNNFDNPVFSRLDKVIDFDWGRESASAGINSDNFSIQWNGLIRIDESGDYRFYTVSDDGIRLMIDGYAIINNWTRHRSTEDSAVIHMEKGWHKISIDYNDIGYDAVVRLLWMPPHKNKEVVPSTHLSFQ